MLILVVAGAIVVILARFHRPWRTQNRRLALKAGVCDLVVSAGHALIELTDARQLLMRLLVSVCAIHVDLLCVLVASSARVGHALTEVSTNDLVACHHDVGAMARAAHLPCIARHLNLLVAHLE